MLLKKDGKKMKICYVVCCYFGERRTFLNKFEEDVLCYVKSQIECLEKYKHNLSKIIFSFNIEKEHYKFCLAKLL